MEDPPATDSPPPGSDENGLSCGLAMAPTAAPSNNLNVFYVDPLVTQSAPEDRDTDDPCTTDADVSCCASPAATEPALSDPDPSWAGSQVGEDAGELPCMDPLAIHPAPPSSGPGTVCSAESQAAPTRHPMDFTEDVSCGDPQPLSTSLDAWSAIPQVTHPLGDTEGACGPLAPYSAAPPSDFGAPSGAVPHDVPLPHQSRDVDVLFCDGSPVVPSALPVANLGAVCCVASPTDQPTRQQCDPDDSSCANPSAEGPTRLSCDVVKLRLNRPPLAQIAAPVGDPPPSSSFEDRRIPLPKSKRQMLRQAPLAFRQKRRPAFVTKAVTDAIPSCKAEMPTKEISPSSVTPKLYVVDRHHDVLPPICAAVSTGLLPPGASLLHFDSHPDMACLPSSTPKALVANVRRGAYDPRQLHSKCDIATWVLPLVMAGHVSEVVWACGWWCQQMTPGTYSLLVGVYRDAMRVAPAIPDDERTQEGCGDYWMSADCWVSPTVLPAGRPWTLHVCRMRQDASFTKKDVALMRRVTGGRPWLLDFDEDFVSCSNPFQEEFLAFFGREQFETLRELYDPAKDIATHWHRLQSLVFKQLYRDDQQTFLQHPIVRKLLATTPEDLLLRFRDMCADLHASTGGRWVAADLFPPVLLHHTGEAVGLPHHLTGAADMARLLNTLESVLGELTNPALVTIATSRTDKYLPDSQATRIHGAVCRLLCNRYGTPIKELVRLDVPRYSVPFDDV